MSKQKTCEVPDCKNLCIGKAKVCNAHRLRMQRRGTYDTVFRSIETAPLTQARLQKLLDYDRGTGLFTWLVPPRKGLVVGLKPNQGAARVLLTVDGRAYYAYRLAWLYIYGAMPAGVIDHIDGNPMNNRIENLRDVPQSVNIENQRRAKSDSKTGLLGVVYRASLDKYIANIRLDGKQTYLGLFSTAESAHEAYLDAKRNGHVGCSI